MVTGAALFGAFMGGALAGVILSGLIVLRFLKGLAPQVPSADPGKRIQG